MGRDVIERTLLAATIALISACGITRGQRDDATLRASIAERAGQAIDEMADAPVATPYYEVVDRLWIGSETVASTAHQLNPALAETVDRHGDLGMTFSEAVGWLGRHYDLRIQVLDDVRTMPGLSEPMDASHVGTVASFLDMVASRAGVSWRWNRDRVEVFVRETRQYRLDALPIGLEIDNTISNVNAASGTGGGTGATGSPGIATSSGQATVLKAKVDPFAALVEDIEGLVGKDGTVIPNRFLSSVLVTDTPQGHERVAAYVDAANEMATKQVQFAVKVLSVELDATENYGINWDLVYRDLDSRLGLNAQAWSGGADPANTATISLLDPDSRFDGSQALLEALSEQGEVSIEQTANLITLNGRPAPIQVTEDTAYLPSVTALQVPDAGATTSFTGATVTTGFAMRLTPLVRANDEVVVQLELNLSTLRNLRQISPGLGLTAEQPEIDRRQIAPQVLLRSGSTMVLSGFEQSRSNGKQRGIGSPRFHALGGGSQSRSRRSTMVVLITPIVI